MQLSMRNYKDESDYWRIRGFLRQVFLLNDRHEYSWPLYRWDYWRWHVNENIFHLPLDAVIFIWETLQGQLAAVLNTDNPGEALLQVQPEFRSPELELDMLSTAEAQFATRQPDGSQQLVVWSPGGDAVRQDILRQSGYARVNGPEYQCRRAMTQPVVDVPLSEGYLLRSLGDVDEHPARSWVSWKAFHPDEPDERYEGWEWYRNVQRAPLYRRDLDLVAVAPDGELAAFCTLWFDDVTRTASFEPVGTHPNHQRRGLGKALMTEGLRRVRDLGATLVTVGAYSPAARGLYASVGFTDFDLSEPWQKTW